MGDLQGAGKPDLELFHEPHASLPRSSIRRKIQIHPISVPEVRYETDKNNNLAGDHGFHLPVRYHRS
jgi:hypothetical protein